MIRTLEIAPLPDDQLRHLLSVVEDRKGKKKAQVDVSSTAATKPASAKKRLLIEGKIEEAGFADVSAAVQSLLTILAVEHLLDRVKMEDEFKRSELYKDWRPLGRSSNWIEKWERLRNDELDNAVTNAREILEKQRARTKADYLNDGSDWREGCKSFGQLMTKMPTYLIGGLVPEKALTLITAPSFNWKTWIALMLGKAISQGNGVWSFPGPPEVVPCIYHVPEMNEALIRDYMNTLGMTDSENFLVRPMELGLWHLEDARMLASAKGRVVFLDTTGYFNPADDASNYQQAIKFATLVHNLMVAGEAEAVVGLYHPPKGTKEDHNWTLENSVLGSAGYGGILRSCLRVRNLNRELNDPNGWVYVQGLKNPGLKPFQLSGPPPLELKVAPGDSPYLAELMASQAGPSAREIQRQKFEPPWVAMAVVMETQGIAQRKIVEKLAAKGHKVSKTRLQNELSRVREKAGIHQGKIDDLTQE
jgi:hypothetical protein